MPPRSVDFLVIGTGIVVGLASTIALKWAGHRGRFVDRETPSHSHQPTLHRLRPSLPLSLMASGSSAATRNPTRPAAPRSRRTDLLTLPENPNTSDFLPLKRMRIWKRGSPAHLPVVSERFIPSLRLFLPHL
jgi:hypothetical protein